MARGRVSKYKWPSDLELIDYKNKGYTIPRLAKLLDIPADAVSSHVYRRGLSFKKAATGRQQPLRINHEKQEPSTRLQTVEEFLAEGGKINVIASPDWDKFATRKACGSISD